MSEEPTSDATRRSAGGPILKGGALVGFQRFLAACTGGGIAVGQRGRRRGPPSGASPAPSASASPTRRRSPTERPVTGPLTFANWPAYIDLAGGRRSRALLAGSSPTLEAFKKEYGVDVDYEEKIDENEDVLRDDPAGARRPACRPAGT